MDLAGEGRKGGVGGKWGKGKGSEVVLGAWGEYRDSWVVV